MNSSNNGKIWLIVVLAVSFILLLAGCSSSSSSSSSSYKNTYQYGTKESYDAKYGQGSYDSDKQLLDSMRNEWNKMTGK